MFCPKCGCLLSDDAAICKECGLRIRRSIRNALQEDQPSGKAARTKMSSHAARRDLMIAAGVLFSIVLALSVLLTWIEPDGLTGIEVLTDRPYLGRGGSIIACMPAAITVPGVCCAILAVSKKRFRHLILPISIVILGITVLFGLRTEDMGYDLGIGGYLAMFCGTGLLMLEIRDHLGRRY